MPVSIDGSNVVDLSNAKVISSDSTSVTFTVDGAGAYAVKIVDNVIKPDDTTTVKDDEDSANLLVFCGMIAAFTLV